MFRYAIAIPGVVALLGATAMPGQAATADGFGSAEGTFSLTFLEGSTLISSFVTETLDSVEEQEGSGTASALGDTEVDDTSTQFSTDSAEAGPGIGRAESLTSVRSTISVENPEEALTQAFGFSLDWTLEASADAPGDSAFATGAASISLLGPNEDVLFSESLAFGDPDAYGSDLTGGTYSITLDNGLEVAPGDTVALQVRTDAQATASVIPLPAALPLMLTAFGGLLALRRHQRRA